MSNYSKKGGRTALGLVLSLSLIAASTASHAALWGLFGEEKDPLKTERRSPALNSSTSMMSAPSPNLVYGSLPETQPIDYTSAAPTPPVMQSPVAPVGLNAPASPEYLGAPMPTGPMPDSLAMNPLIATPPSPAAMQPRPTTNIAMPPAQFAPQPAQFAPPPPPMSMGMAPMPPMAPMGMPPVPVQQFQASQNIGADGYPKLSSIPTAPMPQPSAVNPRADNLRAELQASQNMIGDTKPYKTAAPADAVRPKNNPAPAAMASAPMPTPMATNPDFIAMPPAQFSPAPAMNPVAMNPMPAPQPMMGSANVRPVFPSGPSVTVHSKRAGGGVVTTPMGNQQVAMMSPVPPAPPAFAPAPMASAPMAPAPMAPSPFANDAAIDVAMASPTPTIEKAPMAPMPKTNGSAFAPAPISPLIVPEIKNQRMVGESSMPVASAYDAPIDSYNGGGYTGSSNFGLNGNSYTIGSHGRAGSGHTAMLPKSRYESYRKNGR